MNFGDLMKQAKEAGTGFTVIPAGLYLAKCIESEYRSSSTGKPQIKTRWEVIEGPHVGEKGLWNYFTLSTDNPKAVAMFLRHMKALGYDEEFFNAMTGYSPEDVVKRISSLLEGRVAQLKVKIEQYNGDDKNGIENFSPAPAGAGVVPPQAADPFSQAAQSASPVEPSPTIPPSTPTAAPEPPKSPF